MTIFDKITSTHQRIERVCEKLLYLELKSGTPRSGEITGMPRDSGGGASNPFDSYLERKEKLEAEIATLNERLDYLWKQANSLMSKANIDAQTKKMMFLRFCKGMQWKKCARSLDEQFPNCKWNENKCFRKYREVLWKIRQIERKRPI